MNTYTTGTKTGDVPQEFKDTTTVMPSTFEKMKEQYSPVVNYGWVCPLCGRALSPWTSICWCNVKTPQITC